MSRTRAVPGHPITEAVALYREARADQRRTRRDSDRANSVEFVAKADASLERADRQLRELCSPKLVAQVVREASLLDQWREARAVGEFEHAQTLHERIKEVRRAIKGLMPTVPVHAGRRVSA